MCQRVPVAPDECDHRGGMRAQGADDGLLVVFVRAEDGVRIVMGARCQSGQFTGVWRQIWVGEIAALLLRHRVVIPAAAVRPGDRAGLPAC